MFRLSVECFVVSVCCLSVAPWSTGLARFLQALSATVLLYGFSFLCDIFVRIVLSCSMFSCYYSLPHPNAGIPPAILDE